MGKRAVVFQVVNSGLNLVAPTKPASLEEALEMSIAKWEFLAKQEKHGHHELHDGGPSTCGLCLLFFRAGHDCGKKCPVAASGHDHCDGTPYEDYCTNKDPGDAEKEMLFLKRLLKKYLQEKEE